MPVDRSALRDVARYLRQVRPIDPAEIAEYLPGVPDPRVIRQVLREEAFDLGLAEGENGSFRPAATGPLRVAPDPVARLPEAIDRRLESILVETYGPAWARGETGAAIRDRIAALKADYYAGRPVEYDRDVALAYAIYHLADYYASTHALLAELAAEGLLPSRARILEVGSGVGGPALAVADVFEAAAGVEKRDPHFEYHGLEPSAAAEVFESLVGDGPRNGSFLVHRQHAESYEPSASFDLILFSNVLSELSEPIAVVERYLRSLAEDGTVLLVAPADRSTSVQLREVERALETSGLTVYGPTVRLWPGEHPTETCWSFDRQPSIEPPLVQRRLAEEAEDPDAVLNTSVQYSHSILRRDDRRRFDVSLDRSTVGRLAELEKSVGKRLDFVLAKLSRNLATDGHPLFKVSDGSESVGVFAVLVNETELNRPLREANYGSLLRFTGALVLFNDDEGAYNLVVDEETVVDQVARVPRG